MANLKTLSRNFAKFGVCAMLVVGVSNPAMAQLRWGSFKDNGCLEDAGHRVYSSVLWGIPEGESWMGTCLKTPATFQFRDGSTLNFPEPSGCTKSSVTELLSIASLIVAVPGLVYKPAGAVSLVLGGGALALDKAGKGALNVWGLFHVDDPVCPGYAVKPKGWIQTIRVTAPGYTNSKIEQGFTAGTFGGDTSQVKVCVKNYGNRTRHFNGDVKGVRPMKVRTGELKCVRMASNTRVQFNLADGTVAATPHKQIVMSLTRFAGGTVFFYWT